MKKQKIQTQPYKGARDFYPDEMQVRNYIFETWKLVAKKFGFEEYDAPLLEPLEIYEAKTGEEIVNNQLYLLTDKAGRKIAIRPEKTPSVARMIAAKIKELPQPMRWFNIGNCWRYEKPQKGRGREFFQFDCDIFGVENISADVEVFSIPIEVMKEFGATEEMFEIRVSNRRFTEFYLEEVIKLAGSISEKNTQIYNVAKIIDRKTKISEEEFKKQLNEARLNQEQITKLKDFLDAGLDFVEKYKDQCYGAKELRDFFRLMDIQGYSKYIKFAPEIMRGLDYYSGIVIEQFDLNPENNRSMYGGGRYDNLIEIYTNQKLPGVGFAMGDITLFEFLKNWNLLPKLNPQINYLVTVYPNPKTDLYQKESLQLASKIRKKGRSVITWLETDTKLDKQLKYADKKKVPNVIILGDEEINNKTVTIKNMKTGKQETKPLVEFLNTLS